jgi:hypothetical protein
MKRCKRCDEARLEQVSVEDQAEVAGHTFTAQLPGDRCRGCGAVAIEGKVVKRFELCIAAELAKSGQRGNEAFKFMRGVLELDLYTTAQLCGVDNELVEIWDSGHFAVDARAVALVAALVVSKFEGGASAIDSLGILRAPRSLSRRVRISLENALAHAATTMQFGSAAHTAPALA